MKTIIFAFSLIGSIVSPAFADGYPFDPTTQQVSRDTLRVRLSEPQVERLSATGLLTFTDAQLSLIQHFYPKANKTQAVIAATFNDGNEGLSDEDVYVFWVSAEEIAITLNPKVISDKQLRESALAEEARPIPSDIRIAPNGQIYIAGKKSSLKDAFEVISRRSVETGLTHRQVDVCVAPPFRTTRYPLRDDADGRCEEARTLDQQVADIFTSLAKQGEAHKVVVTKAW